MAFIGLKVTGMDDVLKHLSPTTYKKAVARSMKRAGIAAKAELPRAIKEIYAIKMSTTEMKTNISYRVIDGGRGLMIRANADRGVSLTKYYGAKDISKQFKGRRGVKTVKSDVRTSLFPRFAYKIKRADGAHYITGEAGRRPFTASVASGYSGIFQREGKSRLPIRTFYGPGLGQIVSKRAVVNKVQNKVNETIRKNLERDWKYYSGRTAA